MIGKPFWYSDVVKIVLPLSTVSVGACCAKTLLLYVCVFVSSRILWAQNVFPSRYPLFDITRVTMLHCLRGSHNQINSNIRIGEHRCVHICTPLLSIDFDNIIIKYNNNTNPNPNIYIAYVSVSWEQWARTIEHWCKIHCRVQFQCTELSLENWICSVGEAEAIEAFTSSNDECHLHSNEFSL